MGYGKDWVLCICNVKFNVDSGHSLQYIWPSNALTSNEIQKLVTLALPDYSDRHDATGELFYLFRFREDCKIPLDSCDVSSQTFYMGYVLFRAMRDNSEKRKHNQQSMVILSRLPFVSFFKSILKFVAPLYYKKGESVLHAFYEYIDTWPRPAANLVLPLIVDDTSISLKTPPCDPVSGDLHQNEYYEDETRGETEHQQDSTRTSNPSHPIPRSKASLESLDISSSIQNLELHHKDEASAIYARIQQHEGGRHLDFSRDLTESNVSPTHVSDDAMFSYAPPAVEILNAETNDFKHLDEHGKDVNEEDDELRGKRHVRKSPVVKEMLSFMPGKYQDAEVFDIFEPILNHMWLLWELAVTGESILIVCPSASWCSNFVILLLAIIEPLCYCGDYRPYFNTFDPDFHTYCSLMKSKKLPPVILGVTNPFFIEAMKLFPTKIVCGSRNPMLIPKSSNDSYFAKYGNKGGAVSWITARHQPILKKDKRLLKRLVTDYEEHSDNHSIRRSRTPSFKSDDSRKLRNMLDGSFWKSSSSGGSSSSSTDKPADDSRSTKNRRQNLKRREIATINNFLIRDHFFELTEYFLTPFEEYFKVDFSNSSVPFSEGLVLRSFSEIAFLSSFQPTGPFSNIPKSKCVQFYKRFIDSSNFRPWLNQYISEQLIILRKNYLLKCTEFDYEEDIHHLSLEKLIDGYTNVQNIYSKKMPEIDSVIARELLDKIKKMISKKLMDGWVEAE